jgi:hypothetical protein
VNQPSALNVKRLKQRNVLLKRLNAAKQRKRNVTKKLSRPGKKPLKEHVLKLRAKRSAKQRNALKLKEK